jgi:hypothetical protein
MRLIVIRRAPADGLADTRHHANVEAGVGPEAGSDATGERLIGLDTQSVVAEFGTQSEKRGESVIDDECCCCVVVVVGCGSSCQGREEVVEQTRK